MPLHTPYVTFYSHLRRPGLLPSHLFCQYAALILKCVYRRKNAFHTFASRLNIKPKFRRRHSSPHGAAPVNAWSLLPAKDAFIFGLGFSYGPMVCATSMPCRRRTYGRNAKKCRKGRRVLHVNNARFSAFLLYGFQLRVSQHATNNTASQHGLQQPYDGLVNASPPTPIFTLFMVKCRYRVLALNSFFRFSR